MHIGSSVGLCPPDVELDDGNPVGQSAGQQWLWRRWLETVETVKALDGEKILLLNGDIAEIDAKGRSLQTITRNPATVTSMAIDALLPMANICDKVMVVRGTAAHTGGSGWVEEQIARDFNNTVWATEKVASWYHLRFTADGVRFDVCHHAGMSGQPHLEKNAANKIAANIMWRYCVDMQQPPPHVAIRAHNHRRSYSERNYRVSAYCLPAWTLATEYVYRIGQENAVADIGASIFMCHNGRFEHVPIDYPLKENPWTLTI